MTQPTRILDQKEIDDLLGFDEEDEAKDYSGEDIFQSPLIKRMQEFSKENRIIALILEDLDLNYRSMKNILNDDWIRFDISNLHRYAFQDDCWYPDLKQIERLKHHAKKTCYLISLLKRFESRT